MSIEETGYKWILKEMSLFLKNPLGYLTKNKYPKLALLILLLYLYFKYKAGLK